MVLGNGSVVAPDETTREDADLIVAAVNAYAEGKS